MERLPVKIGILLVLLFVALTGCVPHHSYYRFDGHGDGKRERRHEYRRDHDEHGHERGKQHQRDHGRRGR